MDFVVDGDRARDFCLLNLVCYLFFFLKIIFIIKYER